MRGYGRIQNGIERRFFLGAGLPDIPPITYYQHVAPNPLGLFLNYFSIIEIILGCARLVLQQSFPMF